jgi:hypothetical protein
MDKMLTSSAVDHEFQSYSSKTKYYKIGICCFCAKQYYHVIECNLSLKIAHLVWINNQSLKWSFSY